MKSSNFDLTFFEEWLKNKQGIADSTIFVYVKSVERFLKKNPNISDIDDYNNFLIDVTKHKRCIHYYFALKLYIKFKITDSKLKERLMTNLIKPKQREDYLKERRYLKEDVIFDVINYMEKQKHRVLAMIQAITGVRAGDILRLSKDNGIMPEEYKGEPVLRLNIIGKRGKRNVVYIHDQVAQHLIMEYIRNNVSETDYYFLDKGTMTKRYGQLDKLHLMIKMNYQWYWIDLKQALNSAGISRDDFATHDFRRCFARRNWIKYKDVLILQKALRHKDPKTTLRYLEQSGLDTIDIHYEMQQ